MKHEEKLNSIQMCKGYASKVMSVSLCHVNLFSERCVKIKGHLENDFFYPHHNREHARANECLIFIIKELPYAASMCLVFGMKAFCTTCLASVAHMQDKSS